MWGVPGGRAPAGGGCPDVEINPPRAGSDCVVFSGNWAVPSARHNHPNLYYCHTPTRVFYDLRESWLASLPATQRPIARVWSRVHRFWNERALPHLDQSVANSRNVQARDLRGWGRD